MQKNYETLTNYLIDNDLIDIANDVKNNVKNDTLILMIIDHFDDETMLKDSSTKLLNEMFNYYVNNK